MRLDLYQECFEQETYYWWHIAKQQLVISLVKKHFGNKKIKILDLGCGTGAILAKLRTFGAVFGADNSKMALRFARKRGLKNLFLCDFNKDLLPFADNYYDVILILDVIEHIKNPRLLLSEISRVLAPDGLLIATAPAYQSLWSYWDKILGHYRRYSRKSLIRLLKNHNFHPIYTSYLHATILAPATLARFIKQKKYKLNKNQVEIKNIPSDFRPLPKWLNSILLSISSLERLILFRISLPFGLSVIAVCQKNKP